MKRHICALLIAAAMLLNFAAASVFAAADLAISADSVTAELKAGETVSVPVRADTNVGYAAGSVDVEWDSTALTLKKVVFTELAPDNGSAAIANSGSYRVMFGDYLAESNISETGIFFTLEFEISAAAIAGDYAILLENANLCDKDNQAVSASLHSGMISLTGDAPEGAFALSAAKTEVTVGDNGEILVPVTADSNPGFVSGQVDVLWNADALMLKRVEFTDLAPDNGSAEIVNDGNYRVMFGSYTAAKNDTGTGTLFTLVFIPKTDLLAGEYAVLLADPSLLNYNIEQIPLTVSAGKIIVKEQTTTTSTTTFTETTTTTTSAAKPTQTATSTTTTKPTTTSATAATSKNSTTTTSSTTAATSNNSTTTMSSTTAATSKSSTTSTSSTTAATSKNSTTTTSSTTASTSKNSTITTSSTTTTTATDENGTTTTTTSPITQTDYDLGDVNDDGKINAVDASGVLAYYAYVSTNQDGGFTEEQRLAADVDFDGKINAVDASNILAYYAYVSTTKEKPLSMKEYMEQKNK